MADTAEEERRKRELLQKLMQGPERWKASELSPEDLKQLQMGESAYQDISLDPSLRNAQMDSMRGLDDIYQRGGRTLQEEAELNRTRFDVNQEASRRDQGILQNMQERGIGGGGAELAARLQSAAMAGQRESDASMDAAASAEGRSLNALQQRGLQARGMEDADYSREAQKARASDEIARFNADTARNFQSQNINAQNQAAMQNANNANSWNMNATEMNYNDAVQSQNRKIAEEEERQRKKQQKSQGTGQVLGGIAGGIAGGFYGGPAGAAAGSGAGSSLGGAIGNLFSDERLKENKKDIPSGDIDEFLQSIDPKSFNYTEPLRNLQSANRAELEGEQSSRQALMDLAKRGGEAVGSGYNFLKEEIPKSMEADRAAQREADRIRVEGRMQMGDRIKSGLNSIREGWNQATDPDSEMWKSIQSGNRLKAEKEAEVRSMVNPLMWLTKPRQDGAQNAPQNPDRVGAMAQDLEGTEIGSKIVNDTPEGKTLDRDNLMGAILSAVKRLDEKKKDKGGQ